MKLKRITPIFGAACLLAATGANAAVIFQDNFSRTGALNGSSLDINNQDSQTWRASTIFTTNGTTGVVANAADGAAYLDFVPTVGNVYTLKATLTSLDANNNNWIAVGFIQSTATLTGATSRHANGGGIAWALSRVSTTTGPSGANDVQFFAGPNTTNLQYENEAGVASNDFEMTLDTTDGSNVLMSLNLNGGALEVTNYNAGSLATLNINGVGFSFDSGGNSSFDNFELSVIPEPGSVMLLGFGVCAFGLRRRRA